MGGAAMSDVCREIGSLCVVENQPEIEQMGIVIDLDPLQVLYVDITPWGAKFSIGTLPVGNLVFSSENSDRQFNDFFELDGTEPLWEVIKAVREVARYFSKK